MNNVGGCAKTILIVVALFVCAGCEAAVYTTTGASANSAYTDKSPMIINDRVADERPLCFEEAIFGGSLVFRCVTVGHFREWARQIDLARQESK